MLENHPINVLSYFDGMSCGQIALNQANIKIDNYFASEIDKNAVAVTQYNFPNTIQLGDVKNIDLSVLPKINLLIGGSPCQSFSVANINRGGFNDENGKLFFHYLNAKNKLKPKYFLYENVATMCKSDKNFISQQLDIEPYQINSSAVSGQSRYRYYWTNIQLSKIEPTNLTISDIKSNDFNGKSVDCYTLDNSNKKINPNKPNQIGFVKNKNRGNRIYSEFGKSVTLTKNSGGLGSKTGLYLIDGIVRKLTAIECERLQTVPDDYTKYGLFNGNIKELSDSQRISMLGNGWTVNIIKHFFENIIC